MLLAIIGVLLFIFAIIPIILGFGKNGIVRGSYAATYQGKVSKNSYFSIFQKYG